jgi:hypothetical protein
MRVQGQAAHIAVHSAGQCHRGRIYMLRCQPWAHEQCVYGIVGSASPPVAQCGSGPRPCSMLPAPHADEGPGTRPSGPLECPHQGHVTLLAARGRCLLVDARTGEQVELGIGASLGFDDDGAGWVEAGGSQEWMGNLFKHTLLFDADSQRHVVVSSSAGMDWYSEFMSKHTPITVTLPGLAQPFHCFIMARANWGARLWWSAHMVSKALFGFGGALSRWFGGFQRSLKAHELDAKHLRRGLRSTLDKRDALARAETQGQEPWIPERVLPVMTCSTQALLCICYKGAGSKSRCEIGARLCDALLQTHLGPRLPLTIDVEVAGAGAGVGFSLAIGEDMRVQAPCPAKLRRSPIGQALAGQLGDSMAEGIQVGRFLQTLLSNKQLASVFAQFVQHLAREVDASVASSLNTDPSRALGRFARKEQTALVKRTEETLARSAMKCFMASRRAMDTADACNYLSVAPDCSRVSRRSYMLCLITTVTNLAIMGPPQAIQQTINKAQQCIIDACCQQLPGIRWRVF